MHRSRAVFLILLITLVTLLRTNAQVSPSSLWGDLKAGTYHVGFRAFWRLDLSRTWQATRRRGQLPHADLKGRPVRIELWYPVALRGSRDMTYRGYIDLPSPKAFQGPATALRDRDKSIASLSAPANTLSALFSTGVAASAGAPPAAGRFPLIIYFPGLNDSQSLNVFVLAEYLASHGYALATVSLLGHSGLDPDSHRTPLDIEATVRDAEFAWSILQKDRRIDPAKLGVMGESLGGVEAMLFAMRNGNVSAAVGLEGTYGFKGATGVMTDFFSYAPQAMTAPMLDLRKNEAQQQTVFDLTAIEGFHFSDRSLITVDQMHHSDFTSFAVVGYQFHYPSTYAAAPGEHPWNRETGYRGYLNVCRLVRAFLDGKLKNEPGATAELMATLRLASNGTFEHVPAAELPPSPVELVTLIKTTGFEHAREEVQHITKALPVEWVVNEKTFNSLGYQLLSTKKTDDAIAAFRLNLSFHPASANAADSLADGYLAAGDVTRAIDSYQRAIELVATDSAFDAEGKRAFSADEKSKIERLKADAPLRK